MRKTLAVVATTAVLSVSGIAAAEATTTPVAAPGTYVTADNGKGDVDGDESSDSGSDKTGLWGLLGLLGLAGLARRRETADTNNSTTARNR